MNKITKAEYHSLAKMKKCLWLGKDLPETTKLTTQWQCLECGKLLEKSYQSMRDYKNPCRCRTGSQMTPKDYKELARSLSEKHYIRLHYNNEKFPENTYEKVKWDFDGHEIWESYHNLAYYDDIPKWIKDVING